MNELVIFARAARVGTVKSRLAAAVGAERACGIYEELLRALAGNLGGLREVTVCFTPEDAEGELRRFFPSGWQFRAQEGDDLGARLDGAIRSCLAEGARKVAVIGSDCPYVTVKDVEGAWRALEVNDVVFGPAEDGGYWLVGMKGAKAVEGGIFDGIAWGTGAVLEESMEKAGGSGLRVGLLRRLGDVDTVGDWEKWKGVKSAEC